MALCMSSVLNSYQKWCKNVYCKCGKIHWAKHPRFQPHEIFHGASMCISWIFIGKLSQYSYKLWMPRKFSPTNLSTFTVVDFSELSLRWFDPIYTMPQNFHITLLMAIKYAYTTIMTMVNVSHTFARLNGGISQCNPSQWHPYSSSIVNIVV